MQSILNTALPFFALIFCGYGAGRLKLLDETAAAGVNTFVFYFALPAFLFGLMSSSPIGEVLNGAFIGAYVTASLAVFTLAALAGRRLFKIGRAEAAVLGLAAVLPNSGYMGMPLISAVLGREAAVPIVVGLTIDGILMIPLGIMIIESSKGRAEGLIHTALTTLSALTRNPLILSIFAGLAVSAAHLTPRTSDEFPRPARRHGRTLRPLRPRRNPRRTNRGGRRLRGLLHDGHEARDPPYGPLSHDNPTL